MDTHDDANAPTQATDRPNLSTEHQRPGDGRLPNDRLDQDQPPSTEGTDAPVRKSSLLGD